MERGKIRRDMIKLDAAFQTVQSSSFKGVTTTVVTDTLFVSSVRLDFTTGAMYATIRKGTGSPFAENLDAVEICVNPDGSFVSSDGAWVGSVAAAPQLVAQLRATFDQFLLASGKITGQAA
jgi:hypothetical protein